jgi:Flp pilus assembly protein TadG
MSVERRARFLLNQRGQALAEFALVLPVLMLLIAGIIDFGRAWNIKQAVTDAAREGARYAVVADGAVTLDTVRAKVKQRLTLAAIDTSAATIDVAGAFHAAGEMTVNVSTQYNMGWVGALLQWAGAPSMVTISTQATMRSEY